jgi:hypothetical protein
LFLVETGEGRILPNRNDPVGLIIRLLNQPVALVEIAGQLRTFPGDEYNPNGAFKLTITGTDK